MLPTNPKLQSTIYPYPYNPKTLTFSLSYPSFNHLPSSALSIPHNLDAPSLLAPSSNTYPTATGVPQLVFPAFTPVGALINRSVKNTGWRIEESSIVCGKGSGRGMIGMEDCWKGGMASIWDRGTDEECRMGCWFKGGGCCVCSYRVVGLALTLWAEEGRGAYSWS
jgi:hypothetical protein